MKNKITKFILVSLILITSVFINRSTHAKVQNITTDFLFDFAAYGDTQNNNHNHLTIVNQLALMKPYFILNMGDYVQNSRIVSQWEMFENIITSLLLLPIKPGLDRNYYPTIGNHDTPLDNYQKTFNIYSEYYSFNYQGFHFISLDTETDYAIGSAQYTWLENDLLQAYLSNKTTIAFFHLPFYANPNNYNNDANIRNNWSPLFEKYGVELVLNGHAHIYQRTPPILNNQINNNGIVYITTGGGGGALGTVPTNEWWNAKAESVHHFVYLQVTNSKIIGSAVNLEGQVFDTFEIENKNNEKYIVTGAQDKRKKIHRFTTNGKKRGKRFFPYKKAGVRIASGDTNLDGKDEIIVGAGKGNKSWVKILKPNGKLRKKFRAFEKSYTGGIDVAAGDINNNGRDEIAVSKLSDDSQVKIFKYNGKKVYFNQNVFNKFTGTTITMGDIDKDKKAELIAGTNVGTRTKVVAYNVPTSNKKGTRKKIKIFPFKKDYKNGIDVAAGDVDGDGKAEIGISKLTEAKTKIKIYKFNKKRRVLGNFRPFHNKYKTGANIDMFDTNSNGKTEIIVGMAYGKNSKPKVKIFKYKGKRIKSFFAYSRKFNGGVTAVGINK